MKKGATYSPTHLRSNCNAEKYDINYNAIYSELQLSASYHGGP